MTCFVALGAGKEKRLIHDKTLKRSLHLPIAVREE